MTDECPTECKDAPNRELPQAGILRKDAEFCELDRVFLTADALKCITLDHSTPFYLYDGAGIQRTIHQMYQSYSFLEKMQPYLPVRYCAYRELIQLLDREGFGFFCESPEELQLLLSYGVHGERIRYGAMMISQETAKQLRDLDATAVIYSIMNLPSVMPRKVDFVCTDYSMAGIVIPYTDLERSRFGLSNREIARMVPLFHDIGAESFGLSLPTDQIKIREDLYSNKLMLLKKTADEIERLCTYHFDRLDLETGYIADYSRPNTLTDDAKTASYLCDTAMQLAGATFNQTILLSPISRILAHFAIFVTSVIGVYRHHGATIVVNAHSDSITDPIVRKRGHVSVAGKEWMDDRFLYYIAGLRAWDNDCFKRSATVRPPETGDLIVFHDVGAAVPFSTPHTALLHTANGAVVAMTR